MLSVGGCRYAMAGARSANRPRRMTGRDRTAQIDKTERASYCAALVKV